VDWARPQGSDAQFWEEKCAQAGKTVKFPEAFTLGQFLQILDVCGVDQEFIDRLEALCEPELRTSEALEETYQKVISQEKERQLQEKLKKEQEQNKEYFKTHKAVLLKQKEKLKKYLKKKPQDERKKRHLQEVEQEIKKL